MENSNLTVRFSVNESPEQVFSAITNVSQWWCRDVAGSAGALNNEFEVRFGHVHYSKHRVTEFVPHEKIVWLVVDSQLNFLQDKSEWTGTETRFEISRQANKTSVVFTHIGLTPAVECYPICNHSWFVIMQESLVRLINTGKGDLHVLDHEIAKKEETKAEKLI